MRAGPLSNPKVIELLNTRLENVWMLAKDVKALASDENTPADLRTLATALAENYIYPVDFQVVSPDGTLHAQGEANRMRQPYLQVLQDGLE